MKRKKPKRQWQKEWFSAREKLTHIRLIKHLAVEPSDWRNYLRMDESTYHDLLKMVTPIIRRQDTNMRQAITPHERLSATLRYLATGCTYEELKFATAISPQALGKIIPDTCRAILPATNIVCLYISLSPPKQNRGHRRFPLFTGVVHSSASDNRLKGVWLAESPYTEELRHGAGPSGAALRHIRGGHSLAP